MQVLLPQAIPVYFLLHKEKYGQEVVMHQECILHVFGKQIGRNTFLHFIENVKFRIYRKNKKRRKVFKNFH